MKSRILGNDLEVSSVGLGCMGMSHAYGSPADENEMCKLISNAVDMGYSFFDTAEIYGTPQDPHHNEKLLGKALKQYRNNVKIATKCGIKFDTTSDSVNHPLIPDARPSVIKKSVEGSLKRLNTDHIDLYYLHRIDPNVPIEEVALTMSDLIKEGKITHWGLSEATEDIIRKANSVCKVTAIQNRYSMMYRDYESLFPVLEELKIGFVAFSPLANGFLSGRYNEKSQFEKGTDYRSVMPQFTKEAVKENQDLLKLLNDLGEEKGATPTQISLAWMISKKPYIVPIPGTRKLDRLKENADSAKLELTESEVLAIDKALDNTKMSQVFGGSKIIKK